MKIKGYKNNDYKSEDYDHLHNKQSNKNNGRITS